MSNAVSMLEQLQNVAVTALGDDEMFNGLLAANGQPVPIVLERKGDIVTQVQTALGQVGICALVMTPLIELFNELLPNMSGWALLMVSVFEDVAVNQSPAGTQIRAIALIQRVFAILHHLPTGLVTDPGDLDTPSFIGIKRPFELTNEGPPLQYSVSFQAHVRLTG
jgi:hypothetical protein